MFTSPILQVSKTRFFSHASSGQFSRFVESQRNEFLFANSCNPSEKQGHPQTCKPSSAVQVNGVPYICDSQSDGPSISSGSVPHWLTHDWLSSASTAILDPFHDDWPYWGDEICYGDGPARSQSEGPT